MLAKRLDEIEITLEPCMRQKSGKMDTIYRQAAIDALGERPMVWAESDYELGARNQYDADVLALETVPPAQPDLSAYSDKLWRAAYERGKKEAEAERKRGKWINVNEGRWNVLEVLKCSVCGEIDNRMCRTDSYCPNCGADMRGREDG